MVDRSLWDETLGGAHDVSSHRDLFYEAAIPELAHLFGAL